MESRAEKRRLIVVLTMAIRFNRGGVDAYFPCSMEFTLTEDYYQAPLVHYIPIDSIAPLCGLCIDWRLSVNYRFNNRNEVTIPYLEEWRKDPKYVSSFSSF